MVKSPKELKFGDIVVKHYKAYTTDPQTIAGFFTAPLGDGFLYRSKFGDDIKSYFADCNLLPYNDNKWNPSN